MTLKDGYRFGGFSGTVPVGTKSEYPPPPRGGGGRYQGMLLAMLTRVIQSSFILYIAV